ncbi:MAG: lipocalin-like domain-containing protein [Gemmatimonadetes bacterium]|nr:lipocalin-like domain-containing protein [Gemmatimonadota bacterium]
MRRLALLLLAAFAAPALAAQSRPTFVGTWSLVSATGTDSTGKPTHILGEQPLGRISYTADGHMAAQLYDSHRAKLGPTPASADAALVRAAFLGLTTYFGRYTVDTVAHTVSHRVEGAYNPDWIGGTLVRSYRFLPGDRLELTVVTDYLGRKPARPGVLVWQRVGK